MMHERLHPPIRAVRTAVALYTHQKIAFCEALSPQGPRSAPIARSSQAPGVGDQQDFPAYSRLLEFKVTRQRAIVHHLLGHHRKAVQQLFRAIALGVTLEIDPSTLAELYFHLGDAYFWLEGYKDMCLVSSAGVSRLESTGCAEIMLLFENLRRAHTSIREHEQAETYARRNRERLPQAPPFPYMGRVYHGLAWTLGVEKKHYDEAIEMLQEGLQVCLGQGDDWSVCECHHSIADVFGMQRKLDEAIASYQQAIEIADLLSYEDMLVYTHIDLGLMLLRRGDLSLASDCLRSGVVKAAEMDNQRYLALGWEGLARLARQTQNSSGLIQALERFAHHGFPFYPNQALQSLHELGTLHMDQGEYEAAAQCFTDGIRQVGTSSYGLTQFLDALQQCYAALDRRAVFGMVCYQLRQQRNEETALSQWWLSPASPSTDFATVFFHDPFCSDTLHHIWSWLDPRGDSRYHLLARNESGKGGLVIEAAANHWLWTHRNFDAPRLLLKMQGDLALETCVLTDQAQRAVAETQRPEAVTSEVPADSQPFASHGGLLVWGCEHTHLRLEVTPEGNVHFWRSKDGQADIIGRGRFIAPSVRLRLERRNHQFAAFCSRDGKDWLGCGECELVLPALTNVGLYAVSSRTVATTTRFAHVTLSIPGGNHAQ